MSSPARTLATSHGSSVTDLRRSTRLLAAILVPVGPAAVAVLRFVLPYDITDDGAAVATTVTAHPAALSAVVWLGVIAVLTLVPAVLWVGRLTRRRTPRLTAAALLLLVPAYLALGLLVAGDLVLWSGVEAGLDVAQLESLYAATHPAVGLTAGVFVVGHVLGTVLLGIAMWRSRAVPRWAAAAVTVSQPLHFVAAVLVASQALDLFAWGLNALGFAAASRAIWRTSDDDWDLPPLGLRQRSERELVGPTAP